MTKTTSSQTESKHPIEFLEQYNSCVRRQGYTPKLIQRLRSRCSEDLQTFAVQFFDHHITRRFGDFHEELFDLYRQSLSPHPLNRRPARRLAIAAPRGAAKTTFKTLIFPLHAVLYRREPYIAILSATLKQAKRRLRNLKAEIQSNALLRAIYPELTDQPSQWNNNSITILDAQIDVYSAGTEIRGISHNQWRPTLIILDDIEDNRSAYSSARREMLLEWYNDVIENLGDTYTAVEIIGTLLHPDSLLNHLLQRPDFQGRTYRSIERFADREDLWTHWRTLYTNLANPKRIEEARAFYEANEHAMLQGAKVLWDAKEDYYTLMTQLTNMGRAAFFKEKQNQPTLTGQSFFDLTRITRFHLNDNKTLTLLPPGENSPIASPSSVVVQDPSHPSYPSDPSDSSSFILPPSSFSSCQSVPVPVSPCLSTPSTQSTQSTSSTYHPLPTTPDSQLPLSSLRIFAFLDAATGRSSTSRSSSSTRARDYAAIVTVAIDPHGYYYVLDAWLDNQAAPSDQVNHMFNLHNHWNYTLFGIEANCFQSLLLFPIEQERIRRRDTGHRWQLPIREVTHTQNKNMRIASLEPLISNGWIRFSDNLPQVFWNQLESFPRCEHDDALDALEAAIALARSLEIPIPRQSSPRRVTPNPLRNY